MRDISFKIKTLRVATARAILQISPDTITLIKENKIPKGNPFEVAKVAAVQAAKNTSHIIPYCHPLPIDFIHVEYQIQEQAIYIIVTVKAIYKTGVEMEALTGASVAALTIYDMAKMLDETMEISEIKLVEKRGGKSDFSQAISNSLRAAVLVMSDSVAKGEHQDFSGQLIVQYLENYEVDVVDYATIADDGEKIRNQLLEYADEAQVDMVITTGGTGLGPRDITSQVTSAIIDREIPGIEEAIRAYGQERTPYAMLSSGKSGLRGKTLIINLPGSKKAVSESLNAIFPAIFHSFAMMRGEKHDRI